MSVRRRRPASAPPPEKYVRFVRDEWPPNLSCEEAVDFWYRAGEAWAQANEYEYPPGSGYLTSPLGDWLDRMRARREARMRVCYAPAYEAGNGHLGG